MFRFYMNKNTKETIHVENVIRTDGGWWFSETSSEGRRTYTVVDRQVVSPDHVLEFLKPLPEDFLQLPCWEGSQVVQVHYVLNQEHLKSVGDLQVIQWESGELPAWVQEELGHLNHKVQTAMKNMVSSQEELINVPLIEKHIRKDYLKTPSYQCRKKDHSHVSEPVQHPSLQFQKEVSSLHQENNLVRDQECQPAVFQEQQSSRVLDYHSLKPQKRNSQVRYRNCQIVMT